MRNRTSLATFAGLLQWRAAEQSETTAFTWLGNRSQDDNHDDTVNVTYADLDRRARAIGALLRQEGPAGERALLLFAPGLEFVSALFGCFYAGWIAVPAYPPPLNKRLGRVQSVARDAQPLVALTSATLLAQVQARIGGEQDLEHLRWRTIDDAMSEDWSPPRLEPDDLAVLQYTSGTTAAPRGVMLTHANLLHNTAQIEKRFGILNGRESRGVIWLPPYHDMGLVGGILEGVFAGFPISLMSPVAFLQRPRRWLESISRTRATISGGPNFAYDLCVERIPATERASLDLSSWQVAFNGSEPVRDTTLGRFADAFGRSVSDRRPSPRVTDWPWRRSWSAATCAPTPTSCSLAKPKRPGRPSSTVTCRSATTGSPRSTRSCWPVNFRTGSAHRSRRR